jgi:hypothetical protein
MELSRLKFFTNLIFIRRLGAEPHTTIRRKRICEDFSRIGDFLPRYVLLQFKFSDPAMGGLTPLELASGWIGNPVRPAFGEN